MQRVISPTDVCCRTCEWWARGEPEYRGNSEYWPLGTCRAELPAKTGWPPTYGHDSCGHYKPCGCDKSPER